jgi:SAM-dependent methyltransferase
MTGSHFRVLEARLWQGGLPDRERALYQEMHELVEDLNRPDPILQLWYELCQWQWKRWEFGSVLATLDLPNAHGKKVMDAGCGYTALIRHLASRGMDAYGFDWDVDEQSSSLGRAAELMYGDRVKYRKQDIRDLKWPTADFDYVVCVSVLEHLWLAGAPWKRLIDKPLPPPSKVFHIRNMRRAIHEMVRVTKPGGKVIITMDCGYGRAVPASVIEPLFGIAIPNFPDLETVRSYWAADESFSRNSGGPYSNAPREYTSLLAVLEPVPFDGADR